MKLIDKNSKDELAPFRETIDSWLLILVGEDPRLKHQKMQENGEKFTEKWEGYRLWRQCNTWPSIYRQFKEYIEKYINIEILNLLKGPLLSLFGPKN